MSWLILVVAGLFEAGWAIGLKFTDGWTRLWPTLATLVTMAIGLYLLGVAMKGLPVGTAYAVWVGIGTVGTVLVGILFMGDAASPLRLLSLGLIVVGIIGLKLTAPA